MLMAFQREQEPAPYGMEGFVAQYVQSQTLPCSEADSNSQIEVPVSPHQSVTLRANVSA